MKKLYVVGLAILMLTMFSGAVWAADATLTDGDNTFVYGAHDGYYRMDVVAEDDDENCLDTRTNSLGGTGDLTVTDLVNVYDIDETHSSWPWNYDRYSQQSDCQVTYEAANSNKSSVGSRTVWIQSKYMFTAITAAIANDTDLSVTVNHGGVSETYDFAIDATARANICAGGYSGWFNGKLDTACASVIVDPPVVTVLSDEEAGADILEIIAASRTSRRGRMVKVYNKLLEADQSGTLVTTAIATFTRNGFFYRGGITSRLGSNDQVSKLLGQMRCDIDVDNATGHCTPTPFGHDQEVADDIVDIVNNTRWSRSNRFASVGHKLLREAGQDGLLVEKAKEVYLAQGIAYPVGITLSNVYTHDQMSNVLGAMRCVIDIDNETGHCG